ncbi:GTP cyclohydrolase I [Nonomuraea fuscirosea]|uniref:GTP cyclohydrolase 1 n=1 Tax=Nonomuraea fuscirosea TaxID=1291556 RepID=A0A2T0LXS8_9ACTN|nr:GTP cyclohydrolase I [Nonomuraea fuscirosea]PRX48921.1 GTP cyclohydrolase I [Nonomuraea fuscirosea]
MTTEAVRPPETAQFSRAESQSPEDVPGSPVNTPLVAGLIRELLIALGEDPQREGLLDTPARVASWWRSFLSPDPSAMATRFADTHASDQLVVVGGLNVWSLCEHHLLPMQLDAHVGYLTDGTVLGLSKFGRIAQRYAGRLQMQERFTRQLADEVATAVGSHDVAVTVHGVHLCMSMRGVRMESARTSTVHAAGRFRTDPLLSQQFLTLTTSGRTT